MQLQVAALCDAATDYSGKLCLLGVFDTIQFAKLPGQHPQCYVALRFVCERAEAGRHEIETRFTRPDGENLIQPIKGQTTIVFPPETRYLSSNIIIMLQNLRFEKNGPHLISVAVDGATMVTIPLTVRLVARRAPPTN